MPAPRNNQCRGCLKWFTDSGIESHQRQSHNPLCKAEYEQTQAASNAQPQHFSGDFYGSQYTLPDLGQQPEIPVPVAMEGQAGEDVEMGSVSADGETVPPSDTVPDSDEEQDAADLEDIIQPRLRSPAHSSAPATVQAAPIMDDLETSGRPFTAAEHAQAEGKHWQRNFVQTFAEEFPDAQAGVPIPNAIPTADQYTAAREQLDPNRKNIWTPFATKLDWCMAYWAKTRGPSSTALDELFAIEDIPTRLGLSYKSVSELNKLIDEHLPGRPKFHVEHLKLGNELHDFYMRDLIPAVRALFGSPEFANELLLSPERHYKDGDRTIRVYSEMNTGRWWWDRQKALEAGATVVPIIISTDKTQLTVFGNKTAYPVYLTIGNIPKSIRRKPSRQAQILIGYLPVAKLSKMKNKTSRRRALGNLFHACMRKLLEPVKEYAESGLAMARGDGVWFRCHPLLACYVADYPEQVFVASTLNGDCVPGQTTYDKLGETGPCEPRDLNDILNVFKLADGPPTRFHAACKANRLRPIHHPFWEQLPHCDIYRSITPDILHQLFQGVLAHLIDWVCTAYGADEIDARCRAMPPNHNARIFTNGISSLSRVTGAEHKDVCRILLGLILDLPLPNEVDAAPLVRCVRAMLDYANYAQYPEVTTETLDAMDAALEVFDDNRHIFTTLGIRIDFNLPKLHHIRHYRPSFEDFGSSDNYNTEQTERLHIDFTKTAWRKTNKKDAYYQMTTIIERSEALHTHRNFVNWRMRAEGHPDGSPLPLPADSILHMHIEMTKSASRPSVSFDDLHSLYGAEDFSDALAYFSVKWREPQLRHSTALRKADDVHIPHYPISVFWKVKFWNHDALRREDGEDTRDTLHVRPAKRDKRGRPVPGRFDTALVRVGRTGEYGVASGLEGFRVAQVRVVFSLPKKTVSVLFPDGPEPPQHLAYVEWFTVFPQHAERDSTLRRISRSVDAEGRRVASIVPITALERSVQLYPCFGPVLDPEWTSFNVLERCTTFRMSHYLDHHMFRVTH